MSLAENNRDGHLLIKGVTFLFGVKTRTAPPDRRTRSETFAERSSAVLKPVPQQIRECQSKLPVWKIGDAAMRPPMPTLQVSCGSLSSGVAQHVISPQTDSIDICGYRALPQQSETPPAFDANTAHSGMTRPGIKPNSPLSEHEPHRLEQRRWAKAGGLPQIQKRAAFQSICDDKG
jgi:hypothetical protein